MGPFKMLVLGQFLTVFAVFLAQIEAEFKGYPMGASRNQNLFFLGSTHSRKYGEVPKSRLVPDRPQITTTTYCPTHFFGLRLDH